MRTDLVFEQPGSNGPKLTLQPSALNLELEPVSADELGRSWIAQVVVGVAAVWWPSTRLKTKRWTR
ncbi:hypothetical protein B566_EDAN006405 [Ephemera danica]|nr:hypothetical protein B566_EDAN006405 [Ephemera danica]